MVVHGHAKRRTSTYSSWSSMKTRCLNKNNQYYKYYGERGITICKRWLKFENFLADMGEKPEGLSLDRINNNGNYEPSNCRWANPATQCYNRRKFRGCSSSYIGVTRSPGRSRWKAQIQVKGEVIYLGYFDTEKEASKAYEKAKEQCDKINSTSQIKRRLRYGQGYWNY